MVVWAPDYVTADDLAEFVRASDDDPYVADYATAASRAVDDLCNRQFGLMDAPATLVYDASRAAQLGNGRWLVQTDDMMITAGLTVAVDGAPVDAGDYRLWEPNAAAFGRPYTGITFTYQPTGDVAVTTKFGWASVPASVPAAVRLQGNRWHVRRESPYGTAGSPAEGSEIRLSNRLDPDVRAILRGARLMRPRRPR